MLQSIIEDIKKEFNYGNMVKRLIIINVAVFVVLNLLLVSLRLAYQWNTPDIYYTIRDFFLISSDWWHNITHPWVIVTTMFFHEAFWHILWNMLFLFWFGRILGDLAGDRRILPLYLLGGIVANIVYFASANLLNYGAGPALGASGAVMAIVVAAGAIAPEYNISLLFIGNVRLKYVVAVIVFLNIIGLGSLQNTGGTFAHLGGAFLGLYFVYQLRKGRDITQPVSNVLDYLRNFFYEVQSPPKSKNVNQQKQNRKKKREHKKEGPAPHDPTQHQSRLDTILDKIKSSGYESLTEEEKEFLFNASKRD